VRPADTSREQTLALSGDPELRRRFAVVNEPIAGNLRFGVLLEFLDRLAGGTALGYVRRALPGARVVTAALDEVVVRRIVDVDRDVRCRARVNHVGRTSMEVGVRVEQAPDGDHLASCYFTMVALGEGGRAAAVPPLEPADAGERERDARARARRSAWRREAEVAVEPPTPDEFRIVAGLYRAQEDPGFRGLLASRLVAETWERTFPEQDNDWKTVFGGYIIRRALELSSICAELVAPHRPVMAAVNRVNFFRPVQVGDKLHLASRVVYTEGRRSASRPPSSASAATAPSAPSRTPASSPS
jgi:acyl-CoA hydrolase